MGVLVKRLCFSPAASIHHTAVMPCFDKKLEASRKEFADAETGTRDVDCVLTSLEVRAQDVWFSVWSLLCVVG